MDGQNLVYSFLEIIFSIVSYLINSALYDIQLIPQWDSNAFSDLNTLGIINKNL